MGRKNRRNEYHAVGHKLISPSTVHMNCPILAKFCESNKCIMMLLNIEFREHRRNDSRIFVTGVK